MNSIEQANLADAEAILSLQKKAYVSEAEIYNDFTIQPLHESLESMKQAFREHLVLKYVEEGVIVGSVRARQEGDTCYVGKLMVHPDKRNSGIGRKLMHAIEGMFEGVRFELFTGSESSKNIAFYESLGYQEYKTEKLEREETVFVFMEKEGQ
ncbi:GNAT family N-acetyltransferase [Shouchella shacheensis]|uniref:GNAT family N-acetyltransferase n=1 Tax=Shouchella shacheensis TaxID=1649580 RepID=UPI00073FD100|nr:GNAT family N-acetyltransferase [Shouchella shacheensis]